MEFVLFLLSLGCGGFSIVCLVDSFRSPTTEEINNSDPPKPAEVPAEVLSPQAATPTWVQDPEPLPPPEIPAIPSQELRYEGRVAEMFKRGNLKSVARTNERLLVVSKQRVELIQQRADQQAAYNALLQACRETSRFKFVMTENAKRAELELRKLDREIAAVDEQIAGYKLGTAQKNHQQAALENPQRPRRKTLFQQAKEDGRRRTQTETKKILTSTYIKEKEERVLQHVSPNQQAYARRRFQKASEKVLLEE